MQLGKFITFEGGEGSGKSTQVRLLAERLRARGISIVETREPGGSPFAERLRALLLDPATEPHGALSEVLMFYAARADHLDKTIRPALLSGAWVISDRFSDSTRVYQGYAGGIESKFLDALDLIAGGGTRPDLTLIIDVPAETGLARAAVRRGSGAGGTGPVSSLTDRYEGRDLAYHKRLREGFLAIAAAEPQRCTVIDGRQSPSEVAAEVWKETCARLHCGGA